MRTYADLCRYSRQHCPCVSDDTRRYAFQVYVCGRMLTYADVCRYSRLHCPCVSDDTRRYAFQAQKEVCKWNCYKLAEVLSQVLLFLLPLHASYTPITRLHAYYPPLTRLLHASYTPLQVLGDEEGEVIVAAEYDAEYDAAYLLLFRQVFLHASFTPLARLLHASYTPLTRL
jgi:hypothetical protein